MRVKAASIVILTLAVCLYSALQAARIASTNQESTAVSDHLIPRQAAHKPDIIAIGSDAQIDRIIVKLAAGTRGRLHGGRLYSLENKDLTDINRVVREYSQAPLKRLTDKPPEQVEREKFLLENSSGHQLADMNNYFSIAVSSAIEAEILANQLNLLPEVEIAYAEPRPLIAVDIAPPTPDYDGDQLYLRPAPEGIDADYARTLTGGDGAGVRIIDVEGNWKFDHEDLETAVGGLIAGDLIDDQNWRNHGTAAIGVLIGGDNGYGITGIIPAAEIGMVSVGTLGTTEAILTAIDSMVAGEILLIELHAPGPRHDFTPRDDQMGYVCMEYWQATFDAMQLAWAKGIIVCEAAGNGFENLDDPIYENLFDTTYRNSHAIMVGAGAPPSGNYGIDRSKMDFSNHGERVNLQGYGQEVVTTGYGFLFSGGGDERQYYTGGFNGTSAATPIVAGAVASLQGIYQDRYSGALLDADRVRDVLIATGSPQMPTGWLHIGPRPNLRDAEANLEPPPDLTLDPQYFDTTLEVGTQISIYFDIINHASDKTLDYSASALDSIAKNPIGDWLIVVNSTGTVAPLSSETVQLIMDGTVIEDRSQIYKGLVEIVYGEQGGPLDLQAFVPVFLSVPCADTTYSIKTSTDPDGPAFDWIDITTIGSEVPSYAWYNDYMSEEFMDDGTTGPHFIGFDFPFYDSVYNYVFIGANGGISFTDTNVNVEGYYNEVPIPNPPFETFVSPFWNDLNLEPSTGGHGTVYYYRNTPDTFIIAYHEVAAYSFPDDTITFEAILTRNGNIKFQYLTVGDSGMQDSAIVGISEYDCRATPHVLEGDPAENIVDDGMAVLFDYSYIIWEMSGDANSDGDVNVGDAVFMISWIFKGGPDPKNMKEADANCDGDPNVGDVVYIINYVFKSGPEPCMYEL
jgi:hypothetical protein